MRTLLHLPHLIFLLTITHITQACNMCNFDQNDPADCKVYGQLGNGNMIGWHKASPECLSSNNIKVQSIDPDQLKSIFPNRDGSDGNVNSFVNYLKIESGSVANGIKAGLSPFYEEGTNGVMMLKDSIDVDGKTSDCKASANDCYNAMKDYFGKDRGATVMKLVGDALWKIQANDRELEQSTIRISLCQDGKTPECNPLSDQVVMIKSENPEKACSAFGLGPANHPLPDNCDYSSSSESFSSSDSSSSLGSSPPSGTKTNGTTSSAGRNILLNNYVLLARAVAALTLLGFVS